MADWVSLDLNSLLPGEPWTSEKALAVYNNTIALAEGAAGAPPIEDAALGSVTSGLVGGKIAGLAYGAVGTTAFLYIANGGITEGSTYAGSSLSPAGIQSTASITSISADTLESASFVRGSATMSGTWRAMGRANQLSGTNRPRATLFLRIS